MLTALARTENASLHWLTEGRGRPYRVGQVASDADGWLLLDELLQETGWQGYQFTDAAGCCCLVLTQPGEFDIKGRTVAYPVVEILAGGIGPKTLERLTQAEASGMPVAGAEISQDEFDRLSDGRMGNYELLGWRGEHGLLHTATPIDNGALNKVAETRAEYRSQDNNERRLLARFRRLSVQAQRQLLDIADTLSHT